MSNVESIEADDWVTFQTDHIFPLAYDYLFTTRRSSQLITYDHYYGINSLQNRLLLKTNIYSL